MKKKLCIILSVALVVLSGIVFAVWACHTTVRYHVNLHRNYFEYTAYTDDNKQADMPLEIMLVSFMADTTTNDGSYVAQTYIQPRGNKLPDKIIALDFAPYQVHIFEKHRLYIEEYSYNKHTGQLIVIMTVEQRRYQTW